MGRWNGPECDVWMRTNAGCRIMDYDIAGLVKEALTKVARLDFAVSGFKCTGIYPFDRNISSDLDYLAADMTNIPQEQIETSSNALNTGAVVKNARKSNSVRHMRTHTGEKPYLCNLCDYRCAAKSYLVNHMRIHTGEKSFRCELCDYRFLCQSKLVSHMRTHTGERPYSCKLCGLTFATKTHLVRHMRIHTGKKPFRCELCDYRSACKSCLVSHMRTHKFLLSFGTTN